MLLFPCKKCFSRRRQGFNTKNALRNARKLQALNPYVDEAEVLKANTRLRYTDHRIILPRREWVTNLIVRSYHIKDGLRAETSRLVAF